MSGNEKANLLTKRTTTTLFVGPEPFCGMGMSIYNARTEMGGEGREIRASLWENLPGLRDSKLFLGDFNKTKTDYLRVLTGFFCKALSHWTGKPQQLTAHIRGPSRKFDRSTIAASNLILITHYFFSNLKKFESSVYVYIAEKSV